MNGRRTAGPGPLGGDGRFLLCGEFHYFRVPRSAWRDRLGAMVDAGLRAASIYVPWNWHSPAEDVLDFTDRDVPERDLIGALEEIANAGLDCVYRPGPFITAEWRQGGIPDWLTDNYPQALARDVHGRPSGQGRMFPVLTHAHPEFADRAQAWLEATLDVATQHGPVANIQLDDEPSYWRTLLEPLAADYNPFLIGHDNGSPSMYARWLLDRYGSLDSVNRAYRSTTRRAEHLDPPRDPATDAESSLRHLDWLEFKLNEVNKYVARLCKVAVDKGFGGGISLLHPYLLPWSAVRTGDFLQKHQLPVQLTNECYLSLFSGSSVTEQKLGAVIATHETYHMWRTPDSVPVTIELQGSNSSYLTAGAMELLYALTVARGIRGVSYYMTVGGTNPPGFEHITGAEYDIAAPIGADGTIRPHYQAIAKLSRIMGGWLGDRLATAQPLRDTWIGGYAPYEMASISGAAAPLGMPHLADVFDSGDIGQSGANSLVSLLALNSISFGYLDLETATPGELADVPQVWVPGGTFMAAETQQHLADYARAGGQLIVLPHVPALDEHLQPCGVLTSLIFGDHDPHAEQIQSEAIVIYTADGQTLAATGTVTVLDPPPGATVLARESRTGQACAFTIGNVTYIGFGLRYMPTAGGGQHEFLLRLLGRTRAAWTSQLPFAAFQLQGPDAGLLCLANPLDTPGEITATYTADQQERLPLPAVLPSIGFTGRGGLLLPVNVRLPNGATLRHATWELTDATSVADQSTLTFSTAGRDKGELAVDYGRYDIKVENGIVVQDEAIGHARVLVIEAHGPHVRIVIGR